MKMRDVDWQIVDVLAEGRNNAPNIANRLDYSRQYIAERLRQMEDDQIVTNIGTGVYELQPDEVPENRIADRGSNDDGG